MSSDIREEKFVIFGAGPAGMGAAWELSERGAKHITVVDNNAEVGGLARTTRFKGYFFDVGPHRFLTKYEEVDALWKKLLGKDLLERPRVTRIYYRGRFFLYPLKMTDALWNLGFWRSLFAGISYLKAQILWYRKDPKNFAEWTTKTFGNRMSQTFFRDYFTKVWGIGAHEVGLDWANQRIKVLRLRDFFGQKVKEFVWQQKTENIGNKFYYPRYGAGQFYEAMRKKLEKNGVRFLMEREITSVKYEGPRITATEVRRTIGEPEIIRGDTFISSIPASFLVTSLTPHVSSDIRALTSAMRFRAHITVNMIIKRKNIFNDSWVYIQSAEYKIARIGNYGAFSPDMLGDPNTSSIGVEFYCFAGDAFWQKTDDELIKLAVDELVDLGFIERNEFGGAFVMRHADAYPTYYLGYREAFAKLRAYLETFENLRLIGRAGMYKYKDQDHALYSGMLTVRNLFGEHNDVWGLGEEKEFFEEKTVPNNTA